jgi:hypothetical protein
MYDTRYVSSITKITNNNVARCNIHSFFIVMIVEVVVTERGM